MTKQDKIKSFDPNAQAIANRQLFGLPFNFEESEIVILPVPWEATVSFHAGTAKAPEAILNASYQVDLYDFDLPELWKQGIYLLDSSADLLERSNKSRMLAKEIMMIQEKGGKVEGNPVLNEHLKRVNEACEEMNKWVFEQASTLVNRNKKVGMIGGDHSTSLGMLHAMSKRYDRFGILQFDAHADLREAYESFTYSHASIMFNAMQIDQMEKLVQVGVRDICEAEKAMIDGSDQRIDCHTAGELNDRLFDGDNWSNVCDTIVASLSDKVYISFDIDCLDPSLCPNTGTPVPGGLTYDQTVYLLKRLKQSGKSVIGFDLVEVGNDQWDGNVAARILYKLCGMLS